MSLASRLRRSTPVAALIVASLALLVAAGGTAFAAKQWIAPKNSVNSSSIKNGSVGSKDLAARSVATTKLKALSVTAPKLSARSVTSAKIVDGTITGVDLAANTVTGAQVDESTLGAVPNLEGYSRVYQRVVASDQTAAGSTNAARAAAPQVALGTVGPVTVYAKCFTYSGGTYAETFVKTSVNGVVLDSDNDDLSGSPFLDTTTDENDANMHSTSTGDNGSNYYLTHSSEFFIGAPGGITGMGEIGEWVKMGTLAAGDGFFGAGNSCHFQGRLVRIS